MYDFSLEHRKQLMHFTVVGKDGKGLANTPVTVVQKDHQFMFACGGFESKEIVEPADESSKAFYEERYRLWRGLFNTATLPFYWG